MSNRSIFYQQASMNPLTDPWDRAEGIPPFDIEGLINGTEYSFHDGQTELLRTPAEPVPEPTSIEWDVLTPLQVVGTNQISNQEHLDIPINLKGYGPGDTIVFATNRGTGIDVSVDNEAATVLHSESELNSRHGSLWSVVLTSAGSSSSALRMSFSEPVNDSRSFAVITGNKNAEITGSGMETFASSSTRILTKGISKPQNVVQAFAFRRRVQNEPENDLTIVNPSEFYTFLTKGGGSWAFSETDRQRQAAFAAEENVPENSIDFEVADNGSWGILFGVVLELRQ